jgi:hypothetical protein
MKSGAVGKIMPHSFSSKEIAEHIAGTVRKTPLGTSPFSHVLMDEFFPPEFYEQIMANMPETRFYGELQHEDARLANGRSARRKLELRPAHLRRLPDAQRKFWTAITEALLSPELEAAYREKFGASLMQAGRFPEGFDKVKLHPAPMLIRDLGGYKISVHCDSFRKAVTTQYYLPSTRSQVHLGTTFHTRDMETGEFIKVKSLEFAPNHGYAFAVTADSWHSVEQMTSADGERNSIMLIYYIDQGPVGELYNSAKRFGLDVRVLCAPVPRQE